jgi:hypothetical protein
MNNQIQPHQPPPTEQQIMANKPGASADEESNPFQLPLQRILLRGMQCVLGFLALMVVGISDGVYNQGPAIRSVFTMVFSVYCFWAISWFAGRRG